MAEEAPTRSVEELATTTAIGVLVSCAPALVEGRLTVGEAFTLDSAAISLFLEERETSGAMRWRVKFDAPEWGAAVILHNRLEDVWEEHLVVPKYTWPEVREASTDVKVWGDAREAAAWLTKNAATAGFDWGADMREQEKERNLAIGKYVAIGLGLLFLWYLLS